MSGEFVPSTVLALLAALYVAAPVEISIAADAPETDAMAEVESTQSKPASDHPHGAPLFELRSRAESRDYKGAVVRRVPHRTGLAVIADFSDTSLEDWQGPGIASVEQLEEQLLRMEEHWAWLSRGLESFQWDVIRITLPVALQPDAYPGWVEYRDAVGALIRDEVEVADYDSNRDDVVDSAWVIASSHGMTYDYMMGGASRNAGVNMFVDWQNSDSLVVGATGNFNHEAAHTIGVPDLYGPYGTIVYLSVMADSWARPPNDFTAYERTLLGWVKPRVVSRSKRRVRFSSRDDRMQAVRIPTSHPSEYFLIEYRHRPDSGYGSTAPVPYHGLAVYHLLEGSSQWVDPPLMKLEPADGSIAPDTAPELTDFVHPENPDMQTPVVLRSYIGDLEVASLDNVRWTRDGGLEVDIEIRSADGPEANLLANPSFENGTGSSPDGWRTDAWDATATFGWERKKPADGRRSVSITASAPNDARWVQTVPDLAPGQSYALCGWLRGRNIVTAADATVGANVSVMGGFVRSESRSGTFNWAQSCVVFEPGETTLDVACRLGFYGSTVTGQLWCDAMSLMPVRRAF
jgi:hypothetical protein